MLIVIFSQQKWRSKSTKGCMNRRKFMVAVNNVAEKAKLAECITLLVLSIRIVYGTMTNSSVLRSIRKHYDYEMNKFFIQMQCVN